MDIQQRQAELIGHFTALTDWEDRYKRIIDAGKHLEAYPEDLRLDKFKVQGCQSQVWLFAKEEDGKVFFHADSDALITKGLIALLLMVYSGATAQEILRTPPSFIGELGLESKLSPSRANGLHSMVKQIKLYAMAFVMKKKAPQSETD